MSAASGATSSWKRRAARVSWSAWDPIDAKKMQSTAIETPEAMIHTSSQVLTEGCYRGRRRRAQPRLAKNSRMYASSSSR